MKAIDASDKGQKPDVRGIQSIENGTKLLRTLSFEGEPMMLKDLSLAAGFTAAKAHTYLVSFRKFGLVEQDPLTGRYSLGRFALELGMTAMRTSNPMRLASNVAERLSEETALNVAVVVWGSFGPTVVELHESGRQLNMNTRPGTVYSMTGTASGRVFSAFMPEEIARAATILEKREVPGIGRVGKSRFMSRSELNEIKQAGYATVEDPPVPGVSAYAAPVFDHTGQMVVALTIIGQKHYLEPQAKDVFVPAMLKATNRLSRELGYRLSI